MVFERVQGDPQSRRKSRGKSNGLSAGAAQNTTNVLGLIINRVYVIRTLKWV